MACSGHRPISAWCGGTAGFNDLLRQAVVSRSRRILLDAASVGIGRLSILGCEPRVAQRGDETMARPRVFVSSTYYDLRHIRGSLEVFIGSLGYDIRSQLFAAVGVAAR